MTPNDIHVSLRRLDPAEAELWITAPEPLTGRVVGPRCRFAGTVEVAHYLKPLPPGTSAPPGTQRVIIPEPSLWEPQTPFLYTAILQTGEKKLTRTLGLRTIQLGPGELRLNRKPFRVAGAWVEETPDFETLRARGVNTLAIVANAQQIELWDAADSWGFCVLGVLTPYVEAATLVAGLRPHPCCMGWLIPETGDALVETIDELSASGDLLGHLVGLRLHAYTPPSWARFLVSIPSIVKDTSEVPWIVIGREVDSPHCLGVFETFRKFEP